MIDWNKHKFEIAALVVALISLVATLVSSYTDFGTYVSSLSERTITATAFSAFPVISVQSEYAKDVEIFYKKKPVPTLYEVTVLLKYSGRPAIRKEDFDQPLMFVFPEGVELINADITDSYPENLEAKFASFQSNEATLSPFLFNPYDFMVVKFLFYVDLNAKSANLQQETLLDSQEQNTIWNWFGNYENTPGPYLIVTPELKGSLKLQGRIADVKWLQVVNGSTAQSTSPGLNRLGTVAVLLGLLIIIALLASAIVRMLRER